MKNQALQAATVCGAVFLFSFVTSAGRDSVTPRERAFQLEYKTTVKDIPTNAKTVDLWIPVPHDNAFQRITNLQIESPYPYKMHTAEYTNKVLHLRLSKPDQTSFSLILRFNAVRKEHIQETAASCNTENLVNPVYNFFTGANPLQDLQDFQYAEDSNTTFSSPTQTLNTKVLTR